MIIIGTSIKTGSINFKDKSRSRGKHKGKRWGDRAPLMRKTKRSEGAACVDQSSEASRCDQYPHAAQGEGWLAWRGGTG